MPITVYWNNDSNTPCTLRPAPLVSISLQINKNGAGEAIGATYSLTLTGTILSDRGNPFGAYSINGTPFQVDDNGSIYVPNIGTSSPGAQGRYGPRNLFHSGSQYGSPDAGPPPQIVSNDYALDSIFSKQRAIRALFARDGQLMEIIPVNGDSVAIACNPRVLSVQFSEGIYVDKCDYTIELEADTLRSANGAVDNEGLVKYWKEGSAFLGNLDGSTVYDATTEAQYILNGEYFISDFSEDWTLDTDEANAQTNQDGFLVPRTYSITHNISAVGKTHYLPDGTKLRAWQQAKGFVQNKLLTFGTAPPAGPIRNYPNSDNTSTTVDGVVTSDINSDPSVIAGMIGKGTLDLIAAYGGYNRVISEQIDEAAGSYSVTETWLLASGTAYETYNINISQGLDNPYVQVSIDGNIKGLSAMTPKHYGGVHTKGEPINSPVGSDRTGVQLDDQIVHESGFYLSPIMNAWLKYDQVTATGGFGYNSEVYKRANFAASHYNDIYRRLNPKPQSRSLAIDETAGTLNYSAAYDNRPLDIFSGVLSESITINDTYPGDIFATVPVIGRATGPLLQYIGSRTEYSRDLSVEMTIDRTFGLANYWGNPLYENVDLDNHNNNTLPAGYQGFNLNNATSYAALVAKKPSVAEPTRTQLQQLIMEVSPMQEPGIRKYFANPPTESWNPKDGTYTLNLSWTYELDR